LPARLKYLRKNSVSVCLKGRGFSHAERKSFSINPNDYETHIELLILYTESGRKDEAVAEAEKILKISLNFSVKAYGERVSYNDPAQAERDMAALRKAGLK
jgi:hypothetical protein